MPPQFSPDILGAPWLAETIGLPPDDEGTVVATLVSRRSPQPQGRAVLHIHGFADYFFHTEYAQWWLDRGYDFYALDLRKYGRSLRPHQTPTFITDIADYFTEIDLAWWRITQRDQHHHVVLSAHSTGGLTAALWADSRQPAALDGVLLNAPWFDLRGPGWLRSPAATRVIDGAGVRAPKRELKRTVAGLYGKSLHRSFGGEWDYDLAWKPVESFPVLLGWLRAIRRAHHTLQAGLNVTAPVLILSSDRTTSPTEMTELVHTSDIVLDVDQIHRLAPRVGSHVTSVRIPGARHDVFLSRPAIRAHAHHELGRWLRAYMPLDSPTRLPA